MSLRPYMREVCLVHCLMALYDLRGLLKVELSDKVLWQLFVFVEVMLTRFRRVRKMRKTTVGYVMCLSVFPHATTRLTLDGFSWYLGFYCFSKTYRENSSFIKVWQVYRVPYTRTSIHFSSYLAEFFIEWNISDEICRENQNHILCSVTFSFSKIVPFMR